VPRKLKTFDMQTTATTSTTSSEAKPAAGESKGKGVLDGKAVALVDYLYEEWSVRLALAVFVGYVAPLDERRAYLVIPLTAILVPTLLTSFGLFCHRRGLFRWIYDTIAYYMSAAYLAFLLGIKQLKQSKLGQFFLGLALCNLGFLPYMLWQHIDLFRFARLFVSMLITFVTALRDPVALLLAFDALLRSLSLVKAMQGVRDHYVLFMTEQIDKGSISVLVPIGVVTALLIGAGLFFYLVRNNPRCALQNDEATPLARKDTDTDDDDDKQVKSRVHQQSTVKTV
jgi:hypothetical protein